MIVSDSLVCVLTEYDISGIKVQCDASVSDAAAKMFLEDFSAGWEEALRMVEEEYGDCESEAEDMPVEIYKKDYGFFISVGEIEIRYAYGDYYDVEYSIEAFENALDNMKAAYPQIEYEGYIGSLLSDLHCGEVYQWEFSSKGDVVVYDLLGETLGNIFAEEEEPSTERFEADDESGAAEFWETFAEELEANGDFAETIKVLYAYADWIQKADLDRAVAKILEIAEEYDADKAEELTELIEKLESGEEIEEENVTFADLPDGYMEALDMFMMAEELSGITPKRGEVISSEGVFDIVIAKAEAGDAEAKFTAGKYFIADHMEEETERAIRWIREAADAGMQEAKEYIVSHKEVFRES